MAYLGQNDKELDPNQQAQGQQAQGAAPLVNTGGGVVSSNPVSTAGVGAGGTGGWTNIQSYLQANKNDTSSANILKNQAGSAFEKESQDLTSKANEAKSQAKGQADQTNIAQDQASKLLSQATTGDNQAFSQMQGALKAQYQGPQGFQAGFSSQAQNFQKGLMGDDQNFRSMMGDVYKKSAGGRLGTGALNLQAQLDSNSEALTQARQDLSGRAKALQEMAYGADGKGGLINETDAAVKAEAERFKNQQGQLKNFLGQEQQGASNFTNLENQAEQEAQASRAAQEEFERLSADPMTGIAQAEDALRNSEVGHQMAKRGGIDNARAELNHIQNNFEMRGRAQELKNLINRYDYEQMKLEENKGRLSALQSERDRKQAEAIAKSKATREKANQLKTKYETIQKLFG